MDWNINDFPGEIPSRKEAKDAFYNFFSEFRDYLQEFMRESVVELKVAELPVRGQIKLFDGLVHGKIRLKNQGSISCYLSTNTQGGYRLEPGESIDLFVNNQLFVTTLSGSTTLGMVKT